MKNGKYSIEPEKIIINNESSEVVYHTKNDLLIEEFNNLLSDKDKLKALSYIESIFRENMYEITGDEYLAIENTIKGLSLINKESRTLRKFISLTELSPEAKEILTKFILVNAKII